MVRVPAPPRVQLCRVTDRAPRAMPAGAADKSFRYMNHRWDRLARGDRECYGQIQDAGPPLHDDGDSVLSTTDARPTSSDYNGTGMDVSPALNGCLDFESLNDANDRVNRQFIDDEDVPDEPWLQTVTTLKCSTADPDAYDFTGGPWSSLSCSFDTG